MAVVAEDRLGARRRARHPHVLGAYDVLPGGELRRHSLSSAEELRPLG